MMREAVQSVAKNRARRKARTGYQAGGAVADNDDDDRGTAASGFAPAPMGIPAHTWPGGEPRGMDYDPNATTGVESLGGIVDATTRMVDPKRFDAALQDFNPSENVEDRRGKTYVSDAPTSLGAMHLRNMVERGRAFISDIEMALLGNRAAPGSLSARAGYNDISGPVHRTGYADGGAVDDDDVGAPVNSGFKRWQRQFNQAKAATDAITRAQSAETDASTSARDSTSASTADSSASSPPDDFSGDPTTYARGGPVRRTGYQGGGQVDTYATAPRLEDLVSDMRAQPEEDAARSANFPDVDMRQADPSKAWLEKGIPLPRTDLPMDFMPSRNIVRRDDYSDRFGPTSSMNDILRERAMDMGLERRADADAAGKMRARVLGGRPKIDLERVIGASGLTPVTGYQGGGPVDDAATVATPDVQGQTGYQEPAPEPQGEEAGSKLKRVLNWLYKQADMSAHAETAPPRTGYGAQTPTGFAPTDEELAGQTAPPRTPWQQIKDANNRPSPATANAPTDVELEATGPGYRAEADRPGFWGTVALAGQAAKKTFWDDPREQQRQSEMEGGPKGPRLGGVPRIDWPQLQTNLEDIVRGGNAMTPEEVTRYLHDNLTNNPQLDAGSRVQQTFNDVLKNKGPEEAARFAQSMRNEYDPRMALGRGALEHGHMENAIRLDDAAHNVVPNDRTMSTTFDKNTGVITKTIKNNVTGQVHAFQMDPETYHAYYTGNASQFDHVANNDIERNLQLLTDPHRRAGPAPPPEAPFLGSYRPGAPIPAGANPANFGAASRPFSEYERVGVAPPDLMIRQPAPVDASRIPVDRLTPQQLDEQRDRVLSQDPRDVVARREFQQAVAPGLKPAQQAYQAEIERREAANLPRVSKAIEDYRALQRAAEPRTVLPDINDPRIRPTPATVEWATSESSKDAGKTATGARGGGSSSFEKQQASSRTPHAIPGTPGMPAHVEYNKEAQQAEINRQAAEREALRVRGPAPWERPGWPTNLAQPIPASVFERGPLPGQPLPLPTSKEAAGVEGRRLTAEGRSADNTAAIASREKIADARNVRRDEWTELRKSKQVQDYEIRNFTPAAQATTRIVDTKIKNGLPLTNDEQAVYEHLLDVANRSGVMRQPVAAPAASAQIAEARAAIAAGAPKAAVIKRLQDAGIDASGL